MEMHTIHIRIRFTQLGLELRSGKLAPWRCGNLKVEMAFSIINHAVVALLWSCTAESEAGSGCNHIFMKSGVGKISL